VTDKLAAFFRDNGDDDVASFSQLLYKASLGGLIKSGSDDMRNCCFIVWTFIAEFDH
jgi:hypothetical protein